MATESSRVEVIGLLAGLGAATVGFGLLFTGIFFHFWAQMALTVAALCGIAAAFDFAGFRRLFELRLRSAASVLFVGAVSAAALYEVFYLGNLLAGALPGAAASGVARVYEFKGGTPAWAIGLLMALVIGPGEEIFWRGYLQSRLVARWRSAGLAASVAAYTLVHLVSGNPMLIVAALVCGLFWALLYEEYKSIWVNVVSHTLWDLLVFLIWPFAAGS